MVLKSTSTLVDYSALYRMEDPFNNHSIRLSKKGYSDWLTREQARGLLNGVFVPSTPLKLGVYQGNLVTDILWSGLISVFCISFRVFDLLKVNQVSGWSTYSVELINYTNRILDGYYGFSVNGKEYLPDKTRSEILIKQSKASKGKPREVYKGLYFDDWNWDKSDIFMIKQHGIVVTEKVMGIFVSNKISNVKFTPLSEVEIDVDLDKYNKTEFDSH